MICVLIAGEGPNEIGDGTSPGAIQALLEKIRPPDWKVRRSVRWKDVHKLKTNAPGDGDVRTVAALFLLARESGCNALVFLRDRDGLVSRERSIQKAIINRQRDSLPRAAGGVAIEMLECWLLALRGEMDSANQVNPAKALETRHGVPQKRTAAMVNLIRSAKLKDIPPDAVSLLRWLRSAANALQVKIPKQWPSP